MSDKNNKNKLRVTHYDQIIHLVKCSELDGWYYGQKKHFKKRNEDIIKWAYLQIEKDTK